MKIKPQRRSNHTMAIITTYIPFDDPNALLVSFDIYTTLLAAKKLKQVATHRFEGLATINHFSYEVITPSGVDGVPPLQLYKVWLFGNSVLREATSLPHELGH